MANFKEQFEKILKEKLSQKSTVHTSEETLLIRYFKYFDLNNSGTVSLSEWLRAVEKIGIVVDDISELEGLFTSYDKDQSGSLDYKEFSSSLFGEDSRISRQLQAKPSAFPIHQQRVDDLIELLQDKLRLRGLSGVINFFKAFWIQEPEVSSTAFGRVFKEFRLNISDSDCDFLFNFLDEEGTGLVQSERFLNLVKENLSQSRKDLAVKAYEKIRNESNEVTASVIEQLYCAVGHPDIKLSKRTQDEVLNEFVQTFDLHHSIYQKRPSKEVPLEEFLSYYSFLSFTIQNDLYFDQLLTSTWRLYESLESQKSLKPERIASIGADLSNPLEKLKNKLSSRGARGILGLSKQFQIMDDDGSHTLSLSEFFKACRDFRLDLSELEVRSIFTEIDRDRSNCIDYDELLRAIRGPINSFRRKLVEQAWSRLDKDHNNVLDIDDLRGVYSASKHPDVRSGRKTEEAVLNEFLDTFEMHHGLASNFEGSRKVTKEEFFEYYANVSSSIDDDAYFEVMMNSAWRLQEPLKQQVPWAGAFSSSTFNPNHKAQWLVDHHRSQFGGSVAENAPFGTSNEPVDYSTHLRPKHVDFRDQNIPPAGSASWAGGKLERIRNSALQPGELFNKFKEKLLSRGARGIIGLARIFRIMDDNQNKTLEFEEFKKAVKEFRIDFNDEELSRLFQYFDADCTGVVDYEEFIHRVRGQLNENRKALVLAAFKKLDKSGDGVVGIDDLRGVYNASMHPEVRLGRKTEDEVLCEFLDTFEMHHSIFGNGKRDGNVNFDEFLEYYAHVSASIDDDRYFDLMMKNAWNFEGKSYSKAWKGEV
jgi:Ca2+-binding EF-hand superfamily protein